MTAATLLLSLFLSWLGTRTKDTDGLRKIERHGTETAKSWSSDSSNGINGRTVRSVAPFVFFARDTSPLT